MEGSRVRHPAKACSRLGVLASMLWLLLACPLVAAPSTSQATDIPLENLEIVIHTLDDWGAGTRDSVSLSLGPAYEWVLDLPGEEAFAHGRTSRFRLNPRGLHAADIRELTLSKTRGGDDWALDSLELWINGKPYYRAHDLGVWLNDSHRTWTVTDLDKKHER